MQGWKAIEEAFRKYAGFQAREKNRRKRHRILPSLREGLILHGVNATAAEHFTRPTQILHQM